MTKKDQNNFIIDFFITLGIDTNVENKTNAKKAELLDLVYELMGLIPKDQIAYEKILEVNDMIEEYDILVKREYINFGRALEIMEREKWFNERVQRMWAKLNIT